MRHVFQLFIIVNLILTASYAFCRENKESTNYNKLTSLLISKIKIDVSADLIKSNLYFYEQTLLKFKNTLATQNIDIREKKHKLIELLNDTIKRIDKQSTPEIQLITMSLSRFFSLLRTDIEKDNFLAAQRKVEFVTNALSMARSKL